MSGPGAPRPEVCSLWPSPSPKGPVSPGDSNSMGPPLPLLLLESLVCTTPVFHLNDSGGSCLLVSVRVTSLSATLLKHKSGPGTHQIRLCRCNPETPLWLISSQTPAPAPPRPHPLPRPHRLAPDASVSSPGLFTHLSPALAVLSTWPPLLPADSCLLPFLLRRHPLRKACPGPSWWSSGSDSMLQCRGRTDP